MEQLDNKFINRLDDSESLVDVLIQLENFLDNLDVYVFKNWFEGEVVDGPIIKKYWVGMVLLYDYNNMPDPEGALVLEKHGAKVSYQLRDIEDTDVKKDSLDLPAISQITDIEGGQGVYGDNSVTNNSKHVPSVKNVWLVKIMVPRIFIDELNALDIDVYDENSLDDMNLVQNKEQQEQEQAELSSTEDGTDGTGDEDDSDMGDFQ